MVIHVFGNCSVQRRRNVVRMVTDKVVDVHVCCLSRPDPTAYLPTFSGLMLRHALHRTSPTWKRWDGRRRRQRRHCRLLLHTPEVVSADNSAVCTLSYKHKHINASVAFMTKVSKDVWTGPGTASGRFRNVCTSFRPPLDKISDAWRHITGLFGLGSDTIPT